MIKLDKSKVINFKVDSVIFEAYVLPDNNFAVNFTQVAIYFYTGKDKTKAENFMSHGMGLTEGFIEISIDNKVVRAIPLDIFAEMLLELIALDNSTAFNYSADLLISALKSKLSF